MISTTVRDYASVRGRLGFAFDRFLAFGTAGWAWGNPLNSYASPAAIPTALPYSGCLRMCKQVRST